jgi:hypothetical protein
LTHHPPFLLLPLLPPLQLLLHSPPPTIDIVAVTTTPMPIHEFAKSQDVIGWDNFVMGMVSSKLLPIQSNYLLHSKLASYATCWIFGLITQLLQVTHTQWIYQCILDYKKVSK